MIDWRRWPLRNLLRPWPIGGARTDRDPHRPL